MADLRCLQVEVAEQLNTGYNTLCKIQKSELMYNTTAVGSGGRSIASLTTECEH